MPPQQKKAKTSRNSGSVAVVATAAPAKESKSPLDVLNERTKAVQQRENMIGSVLVVGIDREEEEKAEEDDKEDEGKVVARPYTAEEVSKVRQFLVNQSRADALEKYAATATGGQEDDGCMMFNTTTSNNTIFDSIDELDKIHRLKKAPAKVLIASLG
jgi:hypothetical protein